VKILVRVPEAYLLVREYKATRPGLLVLDSDGRRVAATPLSGAKPAAIARMLDASTTAAARERVRLRVRGPEPKRAAFAKDLKATLAKAGVVRFDTFAGGAVPAQIRKLAKSHGVEFDFIEPVPVAVAESKAPGVWYVEPKRAYVTRLFLLPEHFKGGDLEMRTFRLPGIPKGGGGARVAAAPLATPGVLAIFADIFNDRELVVARKGKVDWKAVAQAFRATGVEPK